MPDPVNPPRKPEPPWLTRWLKAQATDATRVAPQAPQLPPVPVLTADNSQPGRREALREAYDNPQVKLGQGLQAAQAAAEFLPSPFGDVASAGAAVREARAGNPGMAALSAAGILPLVPSLAPAARKTGIASRLKKAISENGGFTFDPRAGEFVQSGGYMVGGVPGQKGLATAKLTPQALEDFMRDNADLLSQEGMMFGGWFDKDSGKYFLDVSEHVPDRDDALRLLQERGEKAAWHLDEGAELVNPNVKEAVSAGAAPRPAEWTPAELEAYGAKHGVPGLGRVSEPSTVKLSDGREVNIPGGTEGDFSYYDLLTLKSQGINPNLMPEGMHEKVHAKMMRSMAKRDGSDEDTFRMLSFGLTSPNSPLTPNEFTVSRIMPQGPEDIQKLAGMEGKSSPEIMHELGVDAGEKGGLGTGGSLDYKSLPKFARMFSGNPDWFRKAADEPWDQYVDRLATQIPGLGTKTASLGGVWQDLPNAAVSAVDRHMAELAMPHILKHAELGPDFRKRAVASWNAVEGNPQLKSLAAIRKRDPIFVRDFLASLINDPQKVNMRTRTGDFGKNVPEHMRQVKWVEEPETTTLMNPYYREALKYNQAHQQAGESLFESQWRLWDKQRGRIEPHEVMFPGLNKLPRMDIEDARKAYQAHKGAKYTIGRPTPNNPVAAGGQLPAVRPVANPMDLAYWGLGGLLLGGGATSAAEE